MLTFFIHTKREASSWTMGVSSESTTMSSQSPFSLYTLNNIILKENLNKIIKKIASVCRRCKKVVSAEVNSLSRIMWLKNALETIKPEPNWSKPLIKRSKSVQPMQRKKQLYCLHQINTMGAFGLVRHSLIWESFWGFLLYLHGFNLYSWESKARVPCENQVRQVPAHPVVNQLSFPTLLGCKLPFSLTYTQLLYWHMHIKLGWGKICLFTTSSLPLKVKLRRK